MKRYVQQIYVRELLTILLHPQLPGQGSMEELVSHYIKQWYCQRFTSHASSYCLPDNYTTALAVSCDTSQLSVSEYTTPHVLQVEKATEARWIQHNIQKDKLGKEEYISWSAFHASLTTNPPTLNAV